MFVENWTEFKKAAEKVYLQNPDKVNLKKPTFWRVIPKMILITFPSLQVRCSMKYDHIHNALAVKVTDDAVVLQFKTDQYNEYKQVRLQITFCQIESCRLG